MSDERGTYGISGLGFDLTYKKLGRTGRGCRGKEIRLCFRRKCSPQLVSFRSSWPSSSEEEGEEHTAGGECPRVRSAAASALERQRICRFWETRDGGAGAALPQSKVVAA